MTLEDPRGKPKIVGVDEVADFGEGRTRPKAQTALAVLHRQRNHSYGHSQAG